MGKTELVSAHGDHVFENTSCTLVGFEFCFEKPEEFNFKAFEEATGWHDKSKFRNVCGSKHKDTDYHLHLIWRIVPPQSLTVQVEFRLGYHAPSKEEKEPFAEDFLRWFSQFITVKEFNLETYGNFDFPTDPTKRFSFPLPMKVPIGPIEAEIDGISFTLPALTGLEKVYVTQAKGEVNFHVHGRKVVIDASSLEPRKEILAMEKTLESLFERRESGIAQ